MFVHVAWKTICGMQYSKWRQTGYKDKQQSNNGEITQGRYRLRLNLASYCMAQ